PDRGQQHAHRHPPFGDDPDSGPASGPCRKPPSRLYIEEGSDGMMATTQAEGSSTVATADWPRPRVLFLCTHNSARSQMAEGLLRHLGGDAVEAWSAGTEVSRVHPLAIRAMEARGIDIRGQRSKSVDELLGQHFDYVITVCDRASETCPIFPGAPERI